MPAIQICRSEDKSASLSVISQLNKGREKLHAETKIYGKNESSICKTSKEKKFVLVLLSHLNAKHIGFDTICGFRHPVGVLEYMPHS